MAGAQFQGGSKSARNAEAMRDDAIRADPSLFRYWKERLQDFTQNGNKDPSQGPTDGFDFADKELDAEITRRKAKKNRSAKRYPSAAAGAVNDNEAE